jgi:hypothetical protein
MVRVHAVWAVHRIAGGDAPRLLATARKNETDPAALAEYAAWPVDEVRMPDYQGEA